MIDRKSAYEILQKRTESARRGGDGRSRGEGRQEDIGGGSRSDGFWTSLGKAIVRSAVPMATRVLEDAIKRGTLGGIQRRR